jgi:para-nitrobenzyl esterase
MNQETKLSRRDWMASATAVAGTLMLAPRLASAQPSAGTRVVETRHGPVRGRVEDGLQVFRGLRYGAAPIGPRRFRPPQPPERWSKVFEADTFGAAAMQTPGADAPKTEVHSEDCLFLNVWTAGLDAKKRPVMVWLHGGAFAEGAAGRPTYYGDHFARDEVVLVSVNHRLNVFGFTQLPDSWGPAYKSSGLAGMLDIVLALKWVKANIAQFGGDPDNVTIFGESGGGGKVSLLLGMPPAKGLFHRAIIQSGASLEAAPRPYAQALGGALIDVLGVKPGDVSALAAIDGKTVLESQTAATEKVKALAPKGFLIDGFVPSIDGEALPRGPFTPGPQPWIADVPLLIGTNRDEMTLFLGNAPAVINQTSAQFEAGVREALPARADAVIAALGAAHPGATPGDLTIAFQTAKTFWIDSVTLADRKLNQPAPVWMYRMDWESPAFGGKLKAGHAMELSLVFGTYDNIRFFVGPGDGPPRLSAQMHPAWVAFARTGDPQTPNLPTWPRYDRQKRLTMIFNLESEVISDPQGDLRRLMSA